MMTAGASPTGLESLHEILLPSPPDWVPQTVGWYVLLALAVLAAVWWAYKGWGRFLANRYRRVALAELGALEAELRATGNCAPVLAKVPVLLKRTALSAFPRCEVAELSGEEWLAFLDRSLGGKDFREGHGRLLRDLAYLPASRLQELPRESVDHLFRLARRWIEGHGVGHESAMAVANRAVRCETSPVRRGPGL